MQLTLKLKSITDCYIKKIKNKKALIRAPTTAVLKNYF